MPLRHEWRSEKQPKRFEVVVVVWRIQLNEVRAPGRHGTVREPTSQWRERASSSESLAETQRSYSALVTTSKQPRGAESRRAGQVGKCLSLGQLQLPLVKS